MQQSQMYLLTDEEKNINTSLLDADLYLYLQNNAQFHKLLKKYKLEQYIQTEYVKRSVYHNMSKEVSTRICLRKCLSFFQR